MLSIGRRIAQDNPERAESFVSELQNCCEDLIFMPSAFALVPDYESRQIRRRPYGDYLIFYRIKANSVDVLHVLHAARDYKRLNFDEN